MTFGELIGMLILPGVFIAWIVWAFTRKDDDSGGYSGEDRGHQGDQFGE